MTSRMTPQGRNRRNSAARGIEFAEPGLKVRRQAESSPIQGHLSHRQSRGYFIKLGWAQTHLERLEELLLVDDTLEEKSQMLQRPVQPPLKLALDRLA